MKNLRSFLLLFLVPSSLALDLQINSFTCDETLPVTVKDLTMVCDNNSTRCTFGSSVNLQGKIQYNGLAKTGFYNDNTGHMYVSAGMKFASITYTLMDSYAVPVCWSYEGGRRMAFQDRELGNGCPDDGVYPYSFQYKFPSNDNNFVSWFSSGWRGTAQIHLYSLSRTEAGQNYENYAIGYCEATFDTSVTTSASSKGFLKTPKSSTTLGILCAILAASLLVCVYCYWCAKKRHQRKFEPTIPGDDITTSFRRMAQASGKAEKTEKVNVDGNVI